MLDSGSNREGCGRTPETACSTLLYLLQQVNRTHLPPSTGIHISTDECLSIDQKTAVSVIISSFSKIPYSFIHTGEYWPSVSVVRYRSGTVNSNTINSKFHLIRSYCDYLARILSFHV